MDDNFKQTIIDNLNLKSTRELQDIWEKGTEEEWQPFVFDAVKEILMRRQVTVVEDEIPDELPNRENKLLADEHLSRAKMFYEQDNLNQVIVECDSAVKLSPESDQAYYWRGLAYEYSDERIKAMADYQQAGKLNPDVDEYWDKIKELQKMLDSDFNNSPCKQYLDQALIYVEDEQPESAMEQVGLALQVIPEIASAYTDLGLVYYHLGKYEQAIESYEHAISLNTRYYDARSNMADAKLKFEEEQYRISPGELPEDYYDELEETISAEETQGKGSDNKDDIAPGWVYMDEASFVVKGTPGHRFRPGMMGLDPLDLDFERARVEGSIFIRLITGKFRTHNPIYQLGMLIIGLLCCIPIIVIGASFILGYPDWNNGLIPSILYIPVGGVLLFNVYRSIWPGDETWKDDDGSAFF